MKHENREHALLSASGANRWLNCTPSARLEDEYGEKKTSEFAAEGTLAHELAECILREELFGQKDENSFARITSDKLYTNSMRDFVEVYTDYCISIYAQALSSNPDAVARIEQKLDLSAYVPESFGTADFCLVSDGTLEVVDLKFGRGIRVSAENNTQLMLYGLGALYSFDSAYDIANVKLTIVQPRLDNISSWEISVEDLKEWANNVLIEKAKAAYDGSGELNPGAWCHFCAIKNRCRKLAEEQMEMAKKEFAKPALLTDEEISEIITKAPRLVEWANSVVEYATRLSSDSGKSWPGLKLVEGRSLSKWKSEKDVVEALKDAMPELTDDEIFNVKLKSITDIKKLLGKVKFNYYLSNLVIKPQGKPTLVPESDNRPAIGLEQAIKDFS